MKKIKDILKEEIKNSKGYLKQFFERCEEGCVEELEWVIDEDTFEDFFLYQSEEYSAIYDFAVVKLAGRLLKVVEEEEKVINKAIAEEINEENRNHYFDELDEYDYTGNN
jgi:hypothetical protein